MLKQKQIVCVLNIFFRWKHDDVYVCFQKLTRSDGTSLVHRLSEEMWINQFEDRNHEE